MERIETYKPHILLPLIIPAQLKIEYLDLLTYITIRSFINNQTKKCFPELRTIAKISGLSFKFVFDSVKRLDRSGLIEIAKGKSNIYTFNPIDYFARIPVSFLSESGLTPAEKSYLLCLRKFFVDGKLETILLWKDIAFLFDLNDKTIKKHYKSLSDKGYIRCIAKNKYYVHMALTDKFNWLISDDEPEVIEVLDQLDESVTDRELFIK